MGLSCVVGKQASGLAFECFADDVVSGDFLDCGQLYASSCPGSALYEALCFEALESSCDGDCADSEQTGEFAVAEGTARGEFAIEDAGAEFLVGLLP